MGTRDRAVWALALIVCVLLLSAPALWNGFPLLQYDTGGYIARWYEGPLLPSRTLAYSLMLNAGAPFGFWPVVLLQSALTVWVMALTLRAHGLGNRPFLLLGVIATLSIVTTLPWLTAILLTDTFAGLSVLALYLLLLRCETLSGRERAGLIVFIAVSAATHSATLAMLLALLACAALVWLIDRERMPIVRLRRGLIAVTLGAAIVLGGNFIVDKRLAWTPGGFALSFGRMLQSGIVTRYLNDHCPNPRLRLCAYRNELPRDADDFFWGEGVFDKLGRFAGLQAEMRTIVWESLVDYPGLQITSAIAATGEQLLLVHSGGGVVNSVWHSYGMIETHAPNAAAAMHVARQQKGELSFTTINRLHYPVALIAMALLPAIMLLAWRKRIPADIGEVAAACALALLANAFVCGAFSNPHDRYGARVVWIAAFAIILALVRLAQDRLGHSRDLP